ncbi:hypothetical protein HI914_05634 [Erysiphe necator]|nr:hypothetical protein HI914_05634 [Erysiphe necator]
MLKKFEYATVYIQVDRSNLKVLALGQFSFEDLKVEQIYAEMNSSNSFGIPKGFREYIAII